NLIGEFSITNTVSVGSVTPFIPPPVDGTGRRSGPIGWPGPDYRTGGPLALTALGRAHTRPSLEFDSDAVQEGLRRHGVPDPERPGAAESTARLGGQRDAGEELDVVEQGARPPHYAGEGVFTHPDRQAGLLMKQVAEPAQQRAAARDHDALVDDVR